MSNIKEIVDSLDGNIGKILHKLELLKQANLKLSKELDASQQKIDNLEKAIVDWEEKYKALKIANSMLGSNDETRETKLKINALIKDIDHCIVQLSD